MLSKEEKQQYSRHLILNEIGVLGQEKLKAAKVLVIGVGGLGCPILQYLTAAGVGTLGLVDYDIVDQSNLQRQVLFTQKDIGKPKVTVAAKRLKALNPFVQFNVYLDRLTNENAMDLFAFYDVVIDGSDNFPTRYLINDACVLSNKPLVFGAIFKFEGQVSVFNYQNGPTYRCIYPNPPVFGEVPNCTDIGVLGVLPGLIGSLQAAEAIKIICGIGKVLSGKLLTYHMLSHRQSLIRFNKTKAAIVSQLDRSYEAFCGFNTSKDIIEIDIQTVKQNPNKYHLLDVREDWEHEDFNIGGQHIPLGDLVNRYKEIKTKKDIAVYCKSGLRSKKAITMLIELQVKYTFFSLALQ